jgi:hypothetical protein
MTPAAKHYLDFLSLNGEDPISLEGIHKSIESRVDTPEGRVELLNLWLESTHLVIINSKRNPETLLDNIQEVIAFIAIFNPEEMPITQMCEVWKVLRELAELTYPRPTRFEHILRGD